MSTVDDRPTMGERYGSATGSSNLKFEDRRSDLDIIVAAGMVKDGLGLTLHRLMREFDGVRGPIDSAKRWVSSQMELAAALRHQAAQETMYSARRDKLTQAAEDVQKAAVASLRTELLLVLHGMNTIRQAKYAIGAYVADRARASKESKDRAIRLEIDDGELLQLTGRILDVFLDANCHYCDGRGFQGGGRHEHTGPQVICRACKGSGARRDSIGKSDPERLFAGRILMELDSLVHEVQAEIRYALGRVAQAKRLISDQLLA